MLNQACTDQRVRLSEFAPDTAEHEIVLMHCPVNVAPFTMAFNTSFPLFTLVPSIETPIMYASVCEKLVLVEGVVAVAGVIIVVVHVVVCFVVPAPSFMTNTTGMVVHTMVLVSVIEEL